MMGTWLFSTLILITTWPTACGFLPPSINQQSSPPSTACKSYWASNHPTQDCSSTGLEQPPGLLPNTLVLSLSNNSLGRVRHVPHDYRRLLGLRLDRNALERVDVEALAMFEQLQELDLSHNRLAQLILPKNLHTLRTLNLAHNSFIYLPDLSRLTALRFLDVSHNLLTAVPPRLLPLNLEVLRISGNRFSHLTPWPFLTRLKELDVSLNTLECDCSLWQFVNWAEGLALFDSSMLPCRTPGELRKSPIDGKTVCGPTVVSTSQTSSVVALDEPHKLCCTIAATPAPDLFWQLNDKNISRGLSQRHLAESGRVQYCLEIRKVTLQDLGRYRCVAALGGLNASREFSLERDKVPIVLNTAEGLMIYCQLTICVFIGVCCLVSCCVLRSGRKRRTRPQREYYSTKIVEMPQSTCDMCADDDVDGTGDDDGFCESTSPPTTTRTHLDSDGDGLLDATTTSRRPSKNCDDWRDAETIAVRQYLRWREMNHNYAITPHFKHEQLCALSRHLVDGGDDEDADSDVDDVDELRAPLAEFDQDVTFAQFVHTSV